MNAPNAQVHVFEPRRVKRDKFYQPPSRPFDSVEAKAALRATAIAADASATTDINLSLLWRELVRGTSRVVDGFFSDERCYLILALRADGSATPVEGRRLEILEAVLGGLRQKNIAIDLKLAPSTVALNSRLALESLGVVCKPSRAHPLLMLAARAVSEPGQALAKCSMFVGRDDHELRVIGMPRPDQLLRTLLPTAEWAVIRCLVEGLSYSEIAHRRGTSTRTIANQISAVFRRLHVSGRNELVQRLFFDDSLEKQAPLLVTETLAPPTVQDPRPLSSHGVRRSA